MTSMHTFQVTINKMVFSCGWPQLGLGDMGECIITIIMGHSHDSFKYPNMLNSKYQNNTVFERVVTFKYVVLLSLPFSFKPCFDNLRAYLLIVIHSIKQGIMLSQYLNFKTIQYHLKTINVISNFAPAIATIQFKLKDINQ